MYQEFAPWWPLLSAPADYAEEAEFYANALRGAGSGAARTLLELGSGGGNNASHLKSHFQMVLVDPSPEMQAHSRLLNPECEHLEGDMRTIRLGRQFDRVFIHDAIMYMTTSADLLRTMETAYVHLRPGGVALFAPDYLRETFRPGTDHGGHDGSDRALRYLEWTWDPDPSDTTYLVDYAYVFRGPDGSVTVENDRHVEGLFARREWLKLLSEVGFDAVAIPFPHSEVDPGQLEVFVATRPA